MISGQVSGSGYAKFSTGRGKVEKRFAKRLALWWGCALDASVKKLSNNCASGFFSCGDRSLMLRICSDLLLFPWVVLISPPRVA